MAHQKDYAFRATRFDLLQSRTKKERTQVRLGKNGSGIIERKKIKHREKRLET
jgi:hypothetical protein